MVVKPELTNSRSEEEVCARAAITKTYSLTMTTDDENDYGLLLTMYKTLLYMIIIMKKLIIMMMMTAGLAVLRCISIVCY